MRLAAFPKCYIEDLCATRTMSVFDWIELAERELKPIGVSGLEIYHGFLTSFEPSYLEQVRTAIRQAGFEMPMFCASPDFTMEDPHKRQEEVDREKQMVEIAAQLGSGT